MGNRGPIHDSSIRTEKVLHFARWRLSGDKKHRTNYYNTKTKKKRLKTHDKINLYFKP